MAAELEYYAAIGFITTPGEHAALLEELPVEVGQLCRVVQGLLLHIFWAEHHGVKLTPARRDEVQRKGATS
jgi:hypothetical protein